MEAKLREFQEINERSRALELEILNAIQSVGKAKGFNWSIHFISNLFVGADYVSFKVNGLPKRLEMHEVV